MNDTPKSLADILKEMGVDIAPTPNAQFCHCGTCQEAYEAARHGALQLLDNQCPTWLMQVGISYILIAGLAYFVGNEREPDKESRMTAADIHQTEGLLRNEFAKIALANKEALYDSIRQIID